MTRPTRSTTETIASEQTARYEALRRDALEERPAAVARGGIAVLMRQGVAAWMDAWCELPPAAVRAAQEERQRAPMPDSTTAEIAELVHILAAMALEQTQEVHG